MTLRRREQKVRRLEFGEGWIDVRTKRKYGDTIVAQRAAASRVKAQASAKDAKKEEAAAQIEFDLGAFNLALLERMIVAWSDDEPINEETIQELDDDIIQVVIDTITEGRSEDEKVPLETNSTSPSEQPEESGSPKETEPGGREA